MPNLKMTGFVLMSSLALGACVSTPPAKRQTPPPPPAWMMQPTPDLITPLNGIISISEKESEQPQSK